MLALLVGACAVLGLAVAWWSGYFRERGEATASRGALMARQREVNAAAEHLHDQLLNVSQVGDAGRSRVIKLKNPDGGSDVCECVGESCRCY
jgi:hypothetical protein